MSVKSLLTRMDGGSSLPPDPGLVTSAREPGSQQPQLFQHQTQLQQQPLPGTAPVGALSTLLGVRPSPRDSVHALSHMAPTTLPLSEIQNNPSLTSLQVALHALQLLPEGSEPYKLQMQHIQVSGVRRGPLALTAHVPSWAGNVETLLPTCNPPLARVLSSFDQKSIECLNKRH